MWRSRLLKWIITAIMVPIMSLVWKKTQQDAQEMILAFVRERVLKRPWPLIGITILALVIGFGLGIIQAAEEVGRAMARSFEGVNVYGEMAWALYAGIALALWSYLCFHQQRLGRVVLSAVMAICAIAVVVEVVLVVGANQKFWYNALSPLALMLAYLAGIWQVLKKAEPPPPAPAQEPAGAPPTAIPIPNGPHGA